MSQNLVVTTAGLEEVIEQKAQFELLNDLLSQMAERTQFAVMARFGFITGEKMTFQQIGDELGIKPDRARQAFSKGWHFLNSPKIKAQLQAASL